MWNYFGSSFAYAERLSTTDAMFLFHHPLVIRALSRGLSVRYFEWFFVAVHVYDVVIIATVDRISTTGAEQCYRPSYVLHKLLLIQRTLSLTVTAGRPDTASAK